MMTWRPPFLLLIATCFAILILSSLTAGQYCAAPVSNRRASAAQLSAMVNPPKKLSRRAVFPLLTGAAAGLSPDPLKSPWNVALADEVTTPQGALVPGVTGIRPNPVVDGTWTPPPIATKLGRSRILAAELSPLSQPASPFSDRELYYPPFLFGSWIVTATLKRKVYPYGKSYVPSTSLLQGSPRNRMESVGDSTTYEARYFATGAEGDASSDPIAANLGRGSKTKVISDRAYNSKSISIAYKHLAPIQDVEWDPAGDPTRLTFLFGAGPLAEDMRPLGQRRGEVYVNARRSDRATDEDTGWPVFCGAERTRFVQLGPGSVIVSDVESITEYRAIGGEGGDSVSATSRLAVYLTPNPNSREGVLWQQLGGKAVAFFDYDLDMKRLYEDDPSSGGKRACVYKLKGSLQCI